MKTLLISLASIALFTTTGCVTHGQNTVTNLPPLPPAGTVSTNAAYLAAQIAELKAQAAETSRRLAEYTKANTELAAALKSAQSATQPAPQAEPIQPRQKVLYEWDGNRFVPAVTSASGSATRTRSGFPNAPGRIVGVRVHSSAPKPSFYVDVVENKAFYSLAPNPRGGGW